jgi:hypothetical protein
MLFWRNRRMYKRKHDYHTTTGGVGAPSLVACCRGRFGRRVSRINTILRLRIRTRADADSSHAGVHRPSVCQFRQDGRTASPTGRPPVPRAAGSVSSGATAHVGIQSCNRGFWPNPAAGLSGAVRGKSHSVSAAASHAPCAARLARGRPGPDEGDRRRNRPRLLGTWAI